MRTASQASQMVIIPIFVAVADRLITVADHLDHRPQQLRRHDHGGGADPICVDHFFINIGYGFDHAHYGSDHSSDVSNHTDNVSPLPYYKGRQIDNTDLLRLLTKFLGTLSLTTCHVEIMITAKNNATTTATTFMTTRQKA